MSLEGDVLSYVFGFLEAHDLGRCARVCGMWKDVSLLDVLWRPFIRDMARLLRRPTLKSLLDMVDRPHSLRDVYVKRCWINPSDVVTASRVSVNVDTGRAVVAIPTTHCVHVIRGFHPMSAEAARSAATEAHRRALTECSNPKKRKMSDVLGRRCYLDRSTVY